LRVLRTRKHLKFGTFFCMARQLLLIHKKTSASRLAEVFLWINKSFSVSSQK
jgi:hypothetical protein